MIQQVEVKRYNQAGQWLYSYQDEVIVKDSPEYSDLKTQLKAEQWTLSFPSDQKLENVLIIQWRSDPYEESSKADELESVINKVIK